MSTGLLSKISFPVYKIGINKPTVEDGVTFFIYGKDTKYSDAEYMIEVVDDTNVPGTNLATRRLHLISNNTKLFKLKIAIFFLGDLIKLAKSNLWFIDSKGFLFQYKKSIKVPLVFSKIKNIIPINTGGSIIEVEGIATRFKTLLAPNDDQRYAAILHWNNAYILYGLYDQKYKNTHRYI